MLFEQNNDVTVEGETRRYFSCKKPFAARTKEGGRLGEEMREQRDWMKIYLFKTIHREYNFVVMSTWHYKYEKCLVVSGLSQCSLAHICKYAFKTA